MKLIPELEGIDPVPLSTTPAKQQRTVFVNQAFDSLLTDIARDTKRTHSNVIRYFMLLGILAQQELPEDHELKVIAQTLVGQEARGRPHLTNNVDYFRALLTKATRDRLDELALVRDMLQGGGDNP